MRIIPFAIAILLALPLFSQELPPDQKKKIEEEMKKAEEMLKKAYKDAEKGLPATVPANSSDEKFKPPKKRTDLLAAIPKTTFTKTQFVQYVKTLQQKFELVPSNKKAIAYVQKNYNLKKAGDLNNAACLLWYGGLQREAIYVLIKAVNLSPDSLLPMNNLCAFMNLTGYPHKAVPMLKYGLAKQKNNIFLLNNVGQAYYQLGDLTTANTYLTSCTNIDRYNVEANNTRGHIETSRGNTQAATECYENSIKGGYNKSASEQLGKQGKSMEDIIPMPEPSSYPEMDDNIAFECPSIPTSINQNPEHNAKMEQDQIAWADARAEYDQKANEYLRSSGMNMLNAMRSGPVQMKVGIMFEKANLMTAKSLKEYFYQHEQLVTHFGKWKEEWEKNWNERTKNACLNKSEQECCSIMASLQSQMQSEFKAEYETFCTRMWTNARGHYNTVAYWRPFLSKQRGFLDKDLIQARVILLSHAETLSSAAALPQLAICIDGIEGTPTSKSTDFKDPNCKFTLKIPLAVGSIELTCDAMKISLGEGLLGEVEHNFTSGQTTVAVGAGGQFQSGFLNAEAKQMYYLTLDGNNNLQDAGMRFTGSISGGEMRAGPLQFEAANITATEQISVFSGVSTKMEVSAFNTTVYSKETQIISF